MKFILVVLAIIFLANSFQPTECKESHIELKYSGKNLVGIFIKGVNHVFNSLKDGWKKFVVWTKDVIQKVNNGLTLLGINGKKMYAAITANLEDKAKSFNNLVGEIKKLNERDITSKIREKLIKVANEIHNKTHTFEEEQAFEVDYKAVTNLETALFETINNNTSPSACVKDIKKKAKEIRSDHLGNYTSCTKEAWDAIKEIGTLVWEKVTPVKASVADAAEKFMKAYNNFEFSSAWEFVKQVKTVVFDDIPTAYKAIRKAIDDSKATLDRGSTCILDAYDRSQKDWIALSDALKNCT